MPELLTQDYPFFKAGLPLRSKDLNGLVQYLESEDRITRVCLIGAGIMYGFKINLENALDASRTVVKITKGTGITSLGYVFCLDADLRGEANEDITLDKSEFSDEAAKVLFNEIVTQQQLKSAQVLTDIDVAAGILKENLINKYVLLFYRLSGDESRSGCANCEKGIVTEAHILLITLNQADYTTLIQQGCHTPPAGGTLQQAFPMMKRFLNAESTINEIEFINRYRDIASLALVELRTLFNTLNANAFLKELFNITLSVSRLDDLEKYINKLPPLPRNIQYAYSYLRDLVKAYIEYAETPFGQTVNFLPERKCFPRHLVLGKIVKRDGETNLFIDYSERTRLYRPPFDDLRLDDLEQGRTLFGRLEDMLQHHFFNENADNVFAESRNDLRITPSHAVSTPLSKQAIPFYFNFGGVQGRWNYRLQRTGRTQFIPFYDANKTLTNQAPFDHADFYRIEGLVGKTLQSIKFGMNNQGEITSALHELRKEMQLPFDIVFCLLQPPTGRQPVRGITTLADYAHFHPGLEHQGGVPKGGTFILVIDTGNIDNNSGIRIASAAVVTTLTIVGDFCLPYLCCGQAVEQSVIADFMVESPNEFEQGTDNNTPTYTFLVPRNIKELRIFFKNLSKNADTYEWLIGGKKMGDALDFDSTFNTSTTHLVTLNALKDSEVKNTYTQRIQFKSIEPPVVKANFMVESPNNFEQDEKGYTFIMSPNDKSIQIFFKNLSDNAETFEWLVDNTTQSKDSDFMHKFSINEGIQIVKLNALRDGSAKATHEQEIRFRIIEKLTVTADLTLDLPTDEEGIKNLPYTFDIKENVLFKGKNTKAFTLTLKNPQAELPLSFTNLSSANALTFLWKTFRGNTELNKDNTLSLADAYSFVLPNLKQGVSNDFIIELNAANGTVKDQQSILLSINVPVVVLLHNIGDVTPVEGKPKDIQSPPRGLMGDNAEVINHLRTRHRDYRAIITQAGEENTPLSKTKSFIKTQAFLFSGDNIEDLNKTFKDIVLQYVQNIKREGGVDDDSYRLVLKNLIFFYLDKISHVQADGLSAETDKTLKEIFAKMKSNNSFTPLSILQEEWHSENITTEQNAATVEQLKALFL